MMEPGRQVAAALGAPTRLPSSTPPNCAVPLLPAALLPAGSCSPSERYNLWEIPLWAVVDEKLAPIASMDPPGNAYDNYKREVGGWWGGVV